MSRVPLQRRFLASLLAGGGLLQTASAFSNSATRAAVAATALADALPSAPNCTDGVINTGDTTWVLTATVLVMGMLPGLAFFEAGLLRSKNTLSLVMQVFGGLTILGTMWDFFGYTLVFGKSQAGLIGSLEHAFLIDVPYDDCSPHATNIPAACFAMFMLMFASITPLLMTGAYAERVRLRVSFMLSIFWEILVFYPVAHWIWGNGWLAKMGALDFAGGIVIHTTAGAGALVVAMMIPRRRNFDVYHGEFPPSSIPLAATGAALLWMGWFGFNAGSALSSGSRATSAVVSTQIAASISGMTWILLSALHHKPSVVAAMNGVVAGLAGVTPASGYINNQSTIVLGLLLGVSSYYGVILLKQKLRIDDALDVSVVHGWTGVLGSLFIGVAAERAVNSSLSAQGLVFSGNWRLLGVQTLAVLVAGVWSAFWTFVIIKVISRFTAITVSAEEEEVGLDVLEHGEWAYHGLMLKGREPLFEDLVARQDRPSNVIESVPASLQWVSSQGGAASLPATGDATPALLQALQPDYNNADLVRAVQQSARYVPKRESRLREKTADLSDKSGSNSESEAARDARPELADLSAAVGSIQ